MTPLELDYYGRYTCKAENPHGKAQHEIDFREAREPSHVQQAITDKVTATTIQFRFVAPTDTGGLPIESYSVEYKVAAAGQEWSKSSQRRTWPAADNGVYILERLQPRTTYDFRFAAKNLVGFSEFSASVQLTMPARGRPEPPRLDNRGEEPDGNGVLEVDSPVGYELAWFIPEDNGEPIDYFEISYWPVSFNEELRTWDRIGDVYRLICQT